MRLFKGSTDPIGSEVATVGGKKVKIPRTAERFLDCTSTVIIYSWQEVI